MHTFELSGLGKAPFNIVNPQGHAFNKGEIFWCKHCGTQIKNRHFIKSQDGVVSIVGIDCLSKTGDQGLIDGQRRLKRELKHEQEEKVRMQVQAEREEEQRSATVVLLTLKLLKRKKL